MFVIFIWERNRVLRTWKSPWLTKYLFLPDWDHQIINFLSPVSLNWSTELFTSALISGLVETCAIYFFSAITSICHILKRSLASISRVGGKITEDVSTTQTSWTRSQINWFDKLSLRFLELRKRYLCDKMKKYFSQLCVCLIGRGSEWCSGDYEDRKGVSWTQTEGCSGGTEHWLQVCVHKPAKTSF